MRSLIPFRGRKPSPEARTPQTTQEPSTDVPRTLGGAVLDKPVGQELSYRDELMLRRAAIANAQKVLLMKALEQGADPDNLAPVVADAMNAGTLPRALVNEMLVGGATSFTLLGGQVLPEDLYVDAELVNSDGEMKLEYYIDLADEESPSRSGLEVEYTDMLGRGTAPVDAGMLAKIDAYMGSQGVGTTA